MLRMLLAHDRGVAGAHDLWTRWNLDPVVVLGLAAVIWAYQRGSRRRPPERDRFRRSCFWVGVGAVTLALVSPLDALAVELASAHMVQHILLILVAAPLLARSAPAAIILAGAPRLVRRGSGRLQRRFRLLTASVDVVRSPAVAWLLHTSTLWFWHASGPYDEALADPVVHALEHATFLGTGVLFWSALLRPRGTPRASQGYGALLVFTMGMQSVFLAALLTFATTPWYEGYRATTSLWGLTPLADQQLAGVIMWVPAGLIYVVMGVLLVTAWVGSGRDVIHGSLDDDWTVGSAPDSTTLTRLQWPG